MYLRYWTNIFSFLLILKNTIGINLELNYDDAGRRKVDPAFWKRNLFATALKDQTVKFDCQVKFGTKTFENGISKYEGMYFVYDSWTIKEDGILKNLLPAMDRAYVMCKSFNPGRSDCSVNLTLSIWDLTLIGYESTCGKGVELVFTQNETLTSTIYEEKLLERTQENSLTVAGLKIEADSNGEFRRKLSCEEAKELVECEVSEACDKPKIRCENVRVNEEDVSCKEFFGEESLGIGSLIGLAFLAGFLLWSCVFSIIFLIFRRSEKFETHELAESV